MNEEGLAILHDLLSSGGRAEDMTPEQAPKVRAFFEEETGLGLWYFARVVCGLDLLTPHLHLEMCQILSLWGRPGWRRILMMVPRGSYKTSLGSKALPLWIATKDPEVTIGIFNAAQDQAKSWIGSIRQIVEGSRIYHMLWPERLPTGVHWRERDSGKTIPRTWKWGDTGMLFQRNSMAVSELTFEPYGIGGSSTGRHYTHRIMDDLIGETAATSPVLIEDAIHFVDHARALERPPNGGCELVNCTPWAYRDCYSHMLQKWPDDYQVYRRSLLEDAEGLPDALEGESIHPEAIPTDVARKMAETDYFTFASQYQCIPRASRETSFDPEWIRLCRLEKKPDGEPSLRIDPAHYDPHAVHSQVHQETAPDLVPLHWCDRVLLIDPAPTKRNEKSSEPRARNGLVAMAMDPWGRVFNLEDAALREDPVSVLERAVEMARRWKITKVGIEEVNFSAVYAPLWSAILKHRYPNVELAFFPLRPKGEDKDTRIRRLQAPHREGLWYYRDPGTKATRQELLEYPSSETRDLIDAQSYVVQGLSRPETPGEREREFYSEDEQGRDPFTHY